VLLTAKDRDPRAGTADPKTDDDQEEEEMSAEEDLDTEETTDEATEEEAPASEPAPRAKRPYRKQIATETSAAAVLAAISRGVSDPQKIQPAVRLSKMAVYRALELLMKRDQVVRKRDGKRSYYHPATPPAVEPAPVAPPPAPVRKPAASQAPASLRVQIAALPPAELLALLDALAPVAAHARALRDALAALQGQP
jgi:hypothetical protein